MPPNEDRRRGLIQARFLFNTREQDASETIDQFISSLKKLSIKCQYEASHALIKSLIRDRFIVGIRNKEFQSKLIQQSDDLSLERAIELAKTSLDVPTSIKQEFEDDVPSLHDKLQVQVNVIGARADIKITEEAKIAILIELMNHRSVLMAPSGHESEKASLWEQVYEFAKSVGAPFKSALHLREVFGTWKSMAIRAKQQSNQDIKVTNADKLIWDLLGQESAEDYPDLSSQVESHQGFEDDEEEQEQDDLFTFEENDLESSESSDEGEESDEDKPLKRGRGRPRKETSSSIDTEIKLLILNKLVLQKDVIASRGNEKAKKDIWKKLFYSLQNKLSLSNPSALRGAFRIWKQRSMKKRDNPEEVACESDKLIYTIFDIQDEPIHVKEDLSLSYQRLGLIDHAAKISILQEMARHREQLGMDLGTVYEKEAAWRELHDKVRKDFQIRNLSMKKMKELIRYWQAQAFNGQTLNEVQKWMFFIYNIDRNAAAPFANLKDGVVPKLIEKVPGCLHINSQAKSAIIRELVNHQSNNCVKNQSCPWACLAQIAQENNVSDATKVRLKFVVSQWKIKALQRFQKKTIFTENDRLLFQYFGLQNINVLDAQDMEIESEVCEEVLQMVKSDPSVLFLRTNDKCRKQFWTQANNLQGAFWHWKESQEIINHLEAISNLDFSEDFKVSLINEIFAKQHVLHFGTSAEKAFLWDDLAKSNGDSFQRGYQLNALVHLWKEELKSKLHQTSLKSYEQTLLNVTFGPQGPTFELSKLAKDAILPLLINYNQDLIQGNAKVKSEVWNEIFNKTSHVHNIQNPLVFFKLVKRWKLVTLKKKDLQMTLNDREESLMKCLRIEVSDWIDSELFINMEDSSNVTEIFVPDNAKIRLTNMVSSQLEIVFASSTSMAANQFWNEALDTLNLEYVLICPSPEALQKAFFLWIFEAWKRKFSNEYLSQSQCHLFDLVLHKKSSIENDFDERIKDDRDAFEVEEMMLEKVIEFKTLMQIDKGLFWTLFCKFAQASPQLLNCDTQTIFSTVLAIKSGCLLKTAKKVPLTLVEKKIAQFFDADFEGDDQEDDGDCVFEEDALWDNLHDDVSDDARFAILNILDDHQEIVASRKRGRGDHDRIAVWQKALNVAIEKGVRVENHSKLMKMVREWREEAKKNEEDGLEMAPWQRHLLAIFAEDTIKEEIIDGEDEPWTISKTCDGPVSETIKTAIVKAMMRHRQLIFSLSENEQDSGWRKVYRIAQANCAFYQSINSMRASIDNWKCKSMSKLCKNPAAINELDKMIFSVYEIETGDLDLENIVSNEPIKFEIPVSRLTSGGKMAILDEMLRNKNAIIDGQNFLSHKERFFGWSNVLLVANGVGGNFPDISQLTTYVYHQLKLPTIQKIQTEGSKLNEIDVSVAKIYDFDISGFDVQVEFNDSSLSNQPGCRICQLQFQRFDDLRMHQQMSHGQLPEPDFNRKCRVCGYDIGLEKPAIRAHLRTSHPGEPFVCDHCDQMFLNDSEYYEHAKDHLIYNPMETLEEVLDESDEKNENSTLKQRKRGVYRKRVKIELPTPETDELPKIGKKEGGLCPHCGEYYKHVQQHIMYKHETKKPWKCDQCDYAHALQKGLQEHVRNCHPKESDLKVCHICGYKTTLNHNLKEHIERTHEKKRRFTCNLCDAHFYRKNVMERHVRVDHMGERPHKCNTCGETFKHLIVLKRHIKVIHLKIKETCSLCGNQYTDKKSLQKHQRIHHPEAWAQRPKGRPKR